MEKSKIPDTTIEALTRNFFKESLDYGFKYEDYLKFVNSLLEYAIRNRNNGTGKEIETISSLRNSLTTPTLPIETKNLIIRAFNKESDTKLIDTWSLDKFGRYFLLSMTSSLDGNIEKIISSNNHHFGIITLKDETPIGVVAFLNCDKTHRKAELRKLIGVPEYRALGYGKEATRYWIEYGFKKLELKKIYLNTIDTNIHNIKINEKMGFKVEGILRDEAIVDGVSRDVLRMGLVRKE
ncbi:MAG: GNAT family N-acetyltransferase [Melioribacteraceae bacterium]|nr:GNAT family N-acetyltransferase [Melioribacteraceae bacterium]